MADKTIGELPSLSTMEDDTLIPVEHDGEAKSMAGTVLQGYVYDLVQDDVETISEIIAVGPKGEDGVSPSLSSSKTGKVTTVYYTDATHTTPTVLATLNDGADGTGVGDMLKSTYDADDDGIVDDSEKLGGELPSYYMAASQKGTASGVATLDTNSKVTASQAAAYLVPITSNTTLSASHAGCLLYVTGSRTITIPNSLSAGTEIEIMNYGTGTVTIAAGTNVTINGASTSKTISEQYTSAVLKAITATAWVVQGAIS